MKKKKIKNIILSIIVALITLISVFSCFKGKYTPEPILTPVSALRPANSDNDNFINPTGTYDMIYFNTSLTSDEIKNIFDGLTFNLTSPSGNPAYLVFANSDMSYGIWVVKFTNDDGSYDYHMATVDNSGVFINSDDENNMYWETFYNPYHINNITGVDKVYGAYDVGQQNNLLTNLISPVPFLFEGASNNISWTSTGLDNPNNIQNIYFNTNLSNQAIKNILDTYIGATAGTVIFSYGIGGVLVRCHVINNSANAFIQIIGGTTTLYQWIYDSVDTDESIWWYGIYPSIIDNGNIITSPQGNSLIGFNIWELRSLFSSSNDFVEQSSEDSYEQGYQNGYQAGYIAGETAGYNSGYQAGYIAGETAGYNSGYDDGYDNGYTSGVNNVTTNPQDYNLYTYDQYYENYTSGYDSGYDEGYLAGLDDGASSNINFQYVEGVLNLIGNFLNIEILPNIKLSYALGIVIILSIISIIKMVVK